MTLHTYKDDTFAEAEEFLKMDFTDCGAAEVLKAGFPAYYRTPETPLDLSIKEYPNGRKELVRYLGRDGGNIREEVVEVIKE